MKFPFTFTWAAVAIAQSTHALKSKVSSKSELNGWYSCSDHTFSDQGSSNGQLAECAIYKAPFDFQLLPIRKLRLMCGFFKVVLVTLLVLWKRRW
ncbi:hypothetical protein PHMEG_00038198 [Phytophthora megakarya]|uniref:Uncharacterized protein n=1 Tax=Phytophthora megakarya TaxID=4795 RepID=A0A225UIB2_9STRA|nr:hypothetical protein PHMEG_00038198 [Phytophthora megakarya]